MKKLTGIYTANRNKKRTFSISVPSSWEELQPGQFGSAIYLLQVTTQADPAWIKLSLLTLLFEKHWPVLNGISDQDRETLLNGMHDELGNQVCEGLADFFYTEEPPLYNFFPKIKTKKLDLIPAEKDLSNIGFGEWCFLDTYFNFYFRSHGDEIWLNRMIATVYRAADVNSNPDSPDYSGDLRLPFNENLIPKHADLVKDLPRNTKMAVFQWIAVALKQAKIRRPHVFPKAPERFDADGKPLPVTPNDNPENSPTWMDIYGDLIGPKFGTTDQLKKTNAMFVLDHLEKEQVAMAKYTS